MTRERAAALVAAQAGDGDLAVQIAYREGYRAALEKAAEIVEQRARRIKGAVGAVDPTITASAIRALKEES